MAKRNCLFLLTVILGLSFGFARSKNSFAQKGRLNPEELVAEHLKSIGSPEVLAGIKNRGIGGVAGVDFIQGGTGKMTGDFMFVSAGNMLGMIMRYGALEYPGEYFAFDGQEVTVGHINPGQRSPLADFIYRYNGLTKEGLLGGTLSVAWPLLDVEEKQPKLKYDKEKVEGRELHKLEYDSKKGLDDVNVKLYFEPDTYRHVRTEYRLRIRSDMSLQSGAVVSRSGVPSSSSAMESGSISAPLAGETRPAGIHDAAEDSIYLLIEKFDNFKEVDGLTLPHSYNIEYSVQGRGTSFLAQYAVQANQFIHNGKVSSEFFRAQK